MKKSYADIKAKDISEAFKTQCEIILAYLQRNCKGAANARTKKRIEIDTRISGREVEKVIEWLSKEQDRGICSSCAPPHGYFFPQTIAEMDSYIEQIKSRIASGKERLNSLYPAREELWREEERRQREEAPKQEAFSFDS